MPDQAWTPKDVDNLQMWIIVDMKYFDLREGKFIDLSGNENHLYVSEFRAKNVTIRYKNLPGWEKYYEER